MSQVKITLNGVSLMGPLADALDRVVVHQNVYLPSMFEIHFRESMGMTGGLLLDNPLFGIGIAVSISSISVGVDFMGAPLPPIPLIKGDVTALEAHFEDGAYIVTLRGYDKSYKLHHNRRSAVYKMMPDSAIAMKIAGENGLSCKALAGMSTVNEYVAQDNLSDWEFLQQRARRVGAQVSVDALGIMNFTPIGVRTALLPPVTAKYGSNLLRFNVRANMMGRSTAVVTQSWTNGRPTMGTMPVTPMVQPPQLMAEVGKATALIAGKKATVTDQSLELPTHAMALAKARVDETNLDFVTAEGECLGDPAICAGNTISIDGVGIRFKGSYTITSAIHEIANGGAYRTTFEIGGREASTLSNLVDGAEKPAHQGRINGVMPGVVTSNIDPLNMGRVKVKFPWLDQTVESNYARVATPMAGSSMGLMIMPEVNDEVLVAFEQGDINRPYIVGGLWNMTARPPLPGPMAVKAGKVVQRTLKTSTGHVLLFDDGPGTEKISITDKKGNKIEFNSVTNEITVDSLGKVTVNAKQDVAVKTAGGKLDVEAAQAITIKSVGGDITLDCINFNVKAKAKIDMQANAQTAIKSAVVQVGDSMVQIDAKTMVVNSSGPITMMGKPVNLNPPSLIVLP